MSDETVGLVGIGLLGGAIAERLAAAGLGEADNSAILKAFE